MLWKNPEGLMRKYYPLINVIIQRSTMKNQNHTGKSSSTHITKRKCAVVRRVCGHQVLGTRCLILGTRYLAPGARHVVPGAWYQSPTAVEGQSSTAEAANRVQ